MSSHLPSWSQGCTSCDIGTLITGTGESGLAGGGTAFWHRYFRRDISLLRIFAKQNIHRKSDSLLVMGLVVASITVIIEEL